jgi:hypothetical protein
MKQIMTCVLYGVFGATLRYAGVTVSSWHFWAALACLVLVDVLSFMRGVEG